MDMLPAGLPLVSDIMHERGSAAAPLEFRALYAFIDESRIALGEIRKDLSLDGSDLGGAVDRSPGVRRALQKLGRFCVEADSWGFGDLYELALRLQIYILNSGGRIAAHDFREAIERMLTTLSALLGESVGHEFHE